MHVLRALNVSIVLFMYNIHLKPTPKKHSRELDKAVPPGETLAEVKRRLGSFSVELLAGVRRVDTGRLGIPVFMSLPGRDAAPLMPTRKQMGKGAVPEQAEASAIMELLERYAYFCFWDTAECLERLTWAEAKEKFGTDLIPIEELILACRDEKIDASQAERVMDLREWLFLPVTEVLGGKVCYAPLELFKELNEFNGCSAGNADAESILQGACELVERHVCCFAATAQSKLPTIDLDDARREDQVLADLLAKFEDAGVRVLLKDFSMGMPVPTVAAFAYDPVTVGKTSEYVFTAGTATNPAKAAIRALTEVAQLGGDFCTSSCYEPSGLPKYRSLADAKWLEDGPLVSLSSLPTIESGDILEELLSLARDLGRTEAFPLPGISGWLDENPGHRIYSISTKNAAGVMPTHYTFIPGFSFMERDRQSCLGLFTAKLIVQAENETPETALEHLTVIDNLYPGNAFIPFYRGMALLSVNVLEAIKHFTLSSKLAAHEETKAAAYFYIGYAHFMREEWEKAVLFFEKAVAHEPEVKEYRNYLGTSLYRLKRYDRAADEFSYIVALLDKGSAVDLQNLGLCHKALGNTEDARYFLGTALQLEPSLEAARLHLEELERL